MDRIIKLLIDKNVSRSEFLLLYYRESTGKMPTEANRKELNIGLTQYYTAMKSLNEKDFWPAPF